MTPYFHYRDILNKMSDRCISNLKKSGINEYSAANALAKQINSDNFDFKDEIYNMNSEPIAMIPYRIVYSIDIKSGLIVEIKF